MHSQYEVDNFRNIARIAKAIEERNALIKEQNGLIQEQTDAMKELTRTIKEARQ